jgi:hypothetical protein
MLRGALRVLALLLAVATPGVAVGVAQAQEMTVTDVAVDATAADAVTARELAIAEGQAEAMEILLKRLVPSDQAGRVRRPSAATAAEAVRSVEIADEQIGTTRYRARLTVAFAADAVEAELARQGLSGTVAAGRVLLLPVLRRGNAVDLWGADNPWREAWLAEAERPGAPELVVPLGDLQDIAAITAEAAAALDSGGLRRLASRYDAAEVVVAIAEIGGDPSLGVPVLVRSVGGSGSLADRRVSGPGAGTEAAAFAEAAAATRRALVAPIASGPVERIDVTVPLADLGTWVQIRRRLAAIGEIREVALREYSRREAKVRLGYAGDLGAVQGRLAENGLGLVQENGGWRLLRSGPVGTVPTAPPVAP